MPARPWTRLGVVAVASHLGYELAAGVALPLASRVGAAPAALGYGAAATLAYRAAGRLTPPAGDRRFAVANGLFLSAVTTHFTTWPRETRGGVPWLRECEGLRGRLMPAYNVILYVSAVAAVGGLAENRRALPWGLLTPLLLVPIMRRLTPQEYARLVEQARRRPRWWNRRLSGG